MMKYIKLYEEYNNMDISDNDFYINILKNGLRNASYHTIIVAIEQGLVLDGDTIKSCLGYFWELRNKYDENSFDYQTMIDKLMHTIDPNIEEMLDVRNLGLKSLEFLVRLPKLTRLICSDNNLKSLNGVQYLKDLIYINAENNKISDISALKDNSNIKELNFNNNKITSLEPLRNLHNLNKLNISNNIITSLEPVKEILSDMEHIFIHNNPIPFPEDVINLINFYSAGTDEGSGMVRHYARKLIHKNKTKQNGRIIK